MCEPHLLQGSQIQSIQVPLSYFKQSIFGPLTEPVNSGAAAKCWILKDVTPVGKQPLSYINIADKKDPHYSCILRVSVNRQP